MIFLLNLILKKDKNIIYYISFKLNKLKTILEIFTILFQTIEKCFFNLQYGRNLKASICYESSFYLTAFP